MIVHWAGECVRVCVLKPWHLRNWLCFSWLTHFQEVPFDTGKPFGPKVCSILRSLTSRTFTQAEEVTEDASGLVTWVGPAGDVPSLVYLVWDITQACWICLGLLAVIWEDHKWFVVGERRWNWWSPTFLQSTRGFLWFRWHALVQLWQSTTSIFLRLRALISYLWYL